MGGGRRRAPCGLSHGQQCLLCGGASARGSQSTRGSETRPHGPVQAPHRGPFRDGETEAQEETGPLHERHQCLHSYRRLARLVCLARCSARAPHATRLGGEFSCPIYGRGTRRLEKRRGRGSPKGTRGLQANPMPLWSVSAVCKAGTEFSSARGLSIPAPFRWHPRPSACLPAGGRPSRDVAQTVARAQTGVQIPAPRRGNLLYPSEPQCAHL